MDLLREQPDDPVLFISEWLINKGNQYRSQSQKDIKPNLQLYHQESFQQQQFGNTIQSNFQDTLNFGKSDVKPNFQSSIKSQQEEIKLVDNKNNKKQLNKMQTDFKQQQKQQEKDKDKEKDAARENKSSLFKLDNTKKSQNASPIKNDTKNAQHQQESLDSMQEQFKSNGQSQQLPEIVSFQDPHPIQKQELQAPNPFQQKQSQYANASIQVARSKEGSPIQQKPKSSRRLNHHQVVQMSILNQQKPPVKKQDLSISQPLPKQELTIPLQIKDKPIEQRQNNSQLNTPKSDDQEFQLIVLEPVGHQPPPEDDIFRKSDQKKSQIIKEPINIQNIQEEQHPPPLSSQRSPSKKVYIESTRQLQQQQQPIKNDLSQSRSTSKDKQFVFKQQSLVDRIPAVAPKIKNKKYVSKEPEPMRMSQMTKSKKVYQPQQQQQIQQSGVYIRTEISLSQNNPKSPMQSQRSIQVEEKKAANLEFKELTKEELNKLSKSDKLEYYERKNQIESSKRIEIEREKQYQQQKFSQRSQNSKASYQQEHPREDEHANQFNLENRVHNMSESEPEEDQIQPQQKQSITEAYGFNNQKQDFNPRIIQKNRDQRERIIRKMASILSFSSLDPQVKQTIINAFEEKKFNPNEWVIKQGDEGDQLYLTDQGVLECYIKYQNHNDSKYIRSYHPGELFGEQSLLYGTKRSASVQAKNECVLWALDKQTFDHVLKDQWLNKRQKHQDFLQKIPILETIQEYEKQQIADQLKEHKQKAGDLIIKQGEQGDALYFVVQGKLKALRMEKGIEQEVYSYKEFDYFGELALLKDIPRQASIICESDCLLYALDKKSFKRLMAPIDDQFKRNAEKYISFIR
ncbi:cAMP-dependent protein kinase type I-alpha regulatory subunit [Paramecium bursaria]